MLLPAWVKPAVFLLCLAPLANLVWTAWRDGLGANPIEAITHSTGTWTLVFLLVTLTITPLRRLSGWHGLIRLRRMLGLYAFFYAILHFSTFLVLDHFFDLATIGKDILKRPYITVGFASFVLLWPLALTSTNAMVRRLGGRNWQRLHRLVYVIAAGGVLHYLWLVKKDIREPVLYGLVLVVLLGVRVAHALRQRGAAGRVPAG
jgi:sulfoxide reductase heme-binding subunit YedZ